MLVYTNSDIQFNRKSNQFLFLIFLKPYISMLHTLFNGCVQKAWTGILWTHIRFNRSTWTTLWLIFFQITMPNYLIFFYHRTINRLNMRLRNKGVVMPNVVIVGVNGKITYTSTKSIWDLHEQAFLFTIKRINYLKDQEKFTKKKQSIHLILDLDYLLSSNL